MAGDSGSAGPRREHQSAILRFLQTGPKSYFGSWNPEGGIGSIQKTGGAMESPETISRKFSPFPVVVPRQRGPIELFAMILLSEQNLSGKVAYVIQDGALAERRSWDGPSIMRGVLAHGEWLYIWGRGDWFQTADSVHGYKWGTLRECLHLLFEANGTPVA